MKNHTELNEYIESGVIEAYVLGILNHTEEEHFVRQVNLYPELHAQLKEAELLLKPLMEPAPDYKVAGPVKEMKLFYSRIEDDMGKKKDTLPPPQGNSFAGKPKNLKVILYTIVIFVIVYFLTTLCFYYLL